MATNNNNKVLNVPPLRFPEFSGEWRYLPLNEYLYENKERNKTGFFNKTSVLSVSGDFGVINQIQLLGRSFAGKSVLDYHVVRHGNIIYTKSPLKDFPYGIVKMNEGADGIVSTLYAVYNVRINASGKFIESYFALPRRANKYFKPIVRIGAKHDMKISNTEAIANIVCFPQYVEQQKIAKFLALIGTRISTQNKIIEKLQSLIKGIVVSHYSTIAHAIKVKIRDLGEAYSTMVMSKEQLTNDGNLCVFYGELFTLYGCVIDEVKSRTSLEIVSSTLSHGRDLLFPASTTVDAVSLIAPSALMQKGIILGGDMFGIKVSEAYNPIYLSYYFNYIANKRLAKYAKGTTIIHLHYNDIANVTIELPNIEEQDKIVSTILRYSTKLSIEKNILEKLSDLKQYLLKQLFI